MSGSGMSRLADFDVRQQALDIHHSCIVQAPAGSGKTELLIRRYLALLAVVEQPEQVLAITLTRKAAAEMRARVLQLLSSTKDGDQPPVDEFSAEGWHLAQAVNDQDSRLQWGINDQPGRLRILTIDAFSQGLNQALPLLAGSGVQLSPTDNPQLLYRQAVRELLAGIDQESPCQQELMALLRHLDNRRSQLEGLLVQMLAHRDQWLKLLPHPAQFAEFINEMKQSLTRVCEQGLSDWLAAMPQGWFLELTDLVSYAADNLQERGAALQLPTEVASESLFALDYWLAVAGLLLTNDGGVRKAPNKNQGFPAGKGEPAEKKAALVQLLNELKETPDALALLVQLRGLPRPAISAEDGELIRALVVVLHYAAAELQLVFQQRGEGDFVELSLRALQALSDGEGPTELALALDYRLQHILVDEFQDTSWLQYRLIELLTAGWQPDDGRTLFLVGDPMQSIYRFREADVGLFLRARQEPVGELRLQPLTLTANFRSDGQLVEANNRLFSGLFPAADDIDRGAVKFSPSTLTRPGGAGSGLFCHGFSGDAARSDEASALADLLTAPQAGSGDAILVKNKSHLLAILPLLRARGIRFQAVELQTLAQSDAVLDLLSITRALLHPADRVGWMALLLGPCVGLTLADMTLLLTDEPAGNSIAASLAKPEASRAAMSDDGQRRANNFITHYLAVTGNRGRRLRQQVESLWLALGGPAVLTGRIGLSDADDFLRLLDDSQGDGRELSIEQLNRLITERYRSSGELDSELLQVMTIHKSKGLQFNRVFIPALDKTGRHDDSPLLAWEEHATAHSSGELLLAPIRSAYDEHHPVYNYIRSLEKVRSQQEQLRLLYVALTRARYEVHLFGVLKRDDDNELKEPASNSLLAALWPGLGARFSQTADDNETPAQSSPATTTELSLYRRRLSNEWQLPELRPSVVIAGADESIVDQVDLAEIVEFDWAGESARIIGVLVHRHLCRLAALPADQWSAHLQQMIPQLPAQLSQAGIAVDEAATSVGRVREALEQAVSDPRGRWILAGGGDLPAGAAHARSEYALTWSHNNEVRNLVIDRTFVDDQGVRWIIDYKTGYRSGGDTEGFLDQEQSRYATQLEEYAAVMKQMGDERIRLGLYFPRMAGWREWAAPD
ncbi:MAG: DNA helicase UvrD [Gammaproteobacteria bacterium]|nr:MAG: DNA helicase UvrD [Gammaproteobacteria bacterium]